VKPAHCKAGTVTCIFSVDDSVTHAFYNDQNVLTDVVGDINNLYADKKLTFTEVPGAVLAIGGKDTQGGECNEKFVPRSGRFALQCTSTNPDSAWHNWKATSDSVRSIGFDKELSSGDPWYKKDNTEDWGVPCRQDTDTNGWGTWPGLEGKVAQHPSELRGADVIWGGKKYSYFTMAPQMVR